MAEKFTGKVVTLEEEAVEEEKEIIEEEEEKIEDPRRWYVRLYERNEPIAKDIFAGALYYSEIDDVIGIDTLTPQFSSDIEGFMESDIIIDQADGDKVFISRWENPKEWIQRLHEAVIGGDYYALEAEAVYETYETQ